MTRDPEQTKTAILDGAEAEFLAKGFGATSLSEVAERAEVTKSLIHHHFGSKEALWAAVKERNFSRYFHLQMRMIEEGEATAELLRESLKAYFRFLEENPGQVRMLAWMALEDDTVLIEQGVRLIRAGIAKIRETQEAGDLRADIDPALIQMLFLGLVEHWFLNRRRIDVCLRAELPASGDQNEAYLEAVVRIFFEGVRKQ